MKNRSSKILYGIFGITLCVIIYELLNIVRYHNILSKGKTGLPTDSSTYELASKNPEEYIKSQIIASHTKYRTVCADLLKHIMYIFIALAFLNATLFKWTMSLSEKKITVISDDFRDLKKAEVNYICFLLGLFLITILTISCVKSKDVDISKLVQYFLLFLGSYYFVFPFVVFFIYLVLMKFKKKFIVACYIALIAKTLPDLLIQDSADLEKMKQMKMSEFPENIREVLMKYDLEHRVYKEKEPSDDMNAALIGYGDGKRMEIYGDINDFSRKELYSILLHEVGHVVEHSLVRKSIIYFSVLILEMLLICWIFDKLAPKYTNDAISLFTSFIALFLIYKMMIRQWPISLHRLASQNSEINSDMFAKKYNYYEPLAEALFNIGVDSNDYLRPTLLYNSIRSTHPSIYNRVEYLKK